MSEHLRKLSPGRIVVLGFAFVILTPSLGFNTIIL